MAEEDPETDCKKMLGGVTKSFAALLKQRNEVMKAFRELQRRHERMQVEFRDAVRERDEALLQNDALVKKLEKMSGDCDQAPPPLTPEPEPARTCASNKKSAVFFSYGHRAPRAQRAPEPTRRGEKVCIICGKKAEHQCSGCKTEHYCSKGCQTVHYPRHKHKCRHKRRHR